MNHPVYYGVDIGGTKIAVIRGNKSAVPQEVVRFETLPARESLRKIKASLKKLGANEQSVIGIACGDPIDGLKGVILSPPNLPGWERIKIVGEIEEEFSCKAYLMNDANAGALAEWRYGAGEQSEHMIFITAGTGFGAGLIFNGRLIEGVSGSAGEIGHVRLAHEGPVGYGKAGSVEGFCSGGGIAQLAQAAALESDGDVSYNPGKVEDITAKHLAEAAGSGSKKALELFEDVGYYYGEALAILIDLLNPERIVLGSIFARCRPYLEKSMREALEQEALSRSLKVCQIVPAGLGEEIGNYAALAAGRYRYKGNRWDSPKEPKVVETDNKKT